MKEDKEVRRWKTERKKERKKEKEKRNEEKETS